MYDDCTEGNVHETLGAIYRPTVECNGLFLPIMSAPPPPVPLEVRQDCFHPALLIRRLMETVVSGSLITALIVLMVGYVIGQQLTTTVPPYQPQMS